MSNAQPELRDWLRAIMKERNMTHRELADLCGFGKATITNIVSYTSKVEAGPDTCRALAQGLGVPEHEVLEVAGWIGRMEPHDADLRLIQHAYENIDDERRVQLVKYAEFLRRDYEMNRGD